MTAAVKVGIYPPGEDVWAAVALNPAGEHCGLIYRKSTDGQFRLLHLGLKFKLHDDDLFASASDYYWSPCAELEVEERKSLAGFAELISEGDPCIPYSLNCHGVTFDQSTGAPVIKGDSYGLTCSTFMVRVFEAQEYEPISWQGWPADRPGDRAFGEYIADLLADPRVREYERSRVVRDQVAQYPRVRPPEAVGAISSSGWPHAVDACERLAAEILADVAPS